MHDGRIQVWTRPIAPIGSFAIGVINQFDYGYPRLVNFTLQDIGLTNPGNVHLTPCNKSLLRCHNNIVGLSSYISQT